MPRNFAFLRGINVGGHRIKMDRLRELFEAMGFTEVETFIASGNVIFSNPSNEGRDLEERIGRTLMESLGYEVATHVRSLAQLTSIAAFEPEDTPDPDPTVYVMFLREAPNGAVRRALRNLNSGNDRFEFAGQEVFWLIRGKLSESPLFGADLAKVTGEGTMTLRKITTVRRLVAKYAENE